MNINMQNMMHDSHPLLYNGAGPEGHSNTIHVPIDLLTSLVHGESTSRNKQLLQDTKCKH